MNLTFDRARLKSEAIKQKIGTHQNQFLKPTQNNAVGIHRIDQDISVSCLTNSTVVQSVAAGATQSVTNVLHSVVVGDLLQLTTTQASTTAMETRVTAASGTSLSFTVPTGWKTAGGPTITVHTGRVNHSYWWSQNKSKRNNESKHQQQHMHSATKEQLHDPIFILAAVQKDGLALRYCSHGIPPTGHDMLSTALQNDLQIVTAAVKQNGRSLEYVHPALKANADVCRAAVTQNGLSLRFVSIDFQDDINMCRVACQQNPWALQHCSASIKKNKPFVIEILKLGGYALSCLPSDVQQDLDVVQASIIGGRLDLATVDQCNDKALVLKAVSVIGNNLRFASNTLRCDVDVVTAACAQNGMALNYARVDLNKKTPDTGHVQNVENADDQQKSDLQSCKKVVMVALKQNVQAIEYVSYALQHDEEVMALHKA